MVDSALLNNNTSSLGAAATSASKDTASSIKQSENASKAELDGVKLGDDFQGFLRLLTTQLQNQDPTEPLDTNEFTQQLVSFSGVEQQVATNKNLEKLVSASVGSSVQQAIGYIGRNIEAVGDKGVLQNSEGYFTYELPRAASDVTVSILDSTGRAVFSGKGNAEAGKTVAFWDGKNSFTKEQMPDGTYQLVVSAKGFQNEKIDVKTFTTGRVNSVETTKDNEVVLNVGKSQLKLNEILSVSEVPSGVKVAQTEQSTTNTQQ